MTSQAASPSVPPPHLFAIAGFFLANVRPTHSWAGNMLIKRRTENWRGVFTADKIDQSEAGSWDVSGRSQGDPPLLTHYSAEGTKNKNPPI